VRSPPRIFAFVLAAALVAPACVARADSLQQSFARANAAYFRADYETAAREYRRLIAAGVIDPDVTYNLATAEARRGNYGEAVQLFERTLWLRPGDDDAERGLDAVRSTLGRRRAHARGEAEVEAGPPVGEAIFGGVSADTIALLAVFFELAFFGILAALLFVRRESTRLALGIGAVVTGGALLVAGLGLTVKSGILDDGEPAIVLREGASMREGPDGHAGERHRALEGQRAWVLDRDRGWTRVRVPALGEGWMQSGDVGLIRAR
jgi:tetratricopeptide (TPR) repeat protein